MGKIESVRVAHLKIDAPGITPTLPNPLTLTPEDPGWKSTDLLDGEWCLNKPDNTWYYRDGGSIHSLDQSFKFIKVENNTQTGSLTIDCENKTFVKALLTDVCGNSGIVLEHSQATEMFHFIADIKNETTLTFPPGTVSNDSRYDETTRTMTFTPGRVELKMTRISGEVWLLRECGVGTSIAIDPLPQKDSVNAVSSGGVYKTIKQTFKVESTSDYGVIGYDEAFKINTVVAADGLTVSIKKSDNSDYMLGDTVAAFNELRFFGDVEGKLFTVKGEII
ncbi:hypothetical protein DMA11_10395 [Marinilabiliaceae bacterium JC017]|nr:hypothetical protein DMA11_10395 [Marinilabiliaceae bacterium JC017]